MSENIPILGGEATLFRRKGSAKWNVRFSVQGQGQVRKSTGEHDLGKATTAARKIFIELTSRAERGLSVSGFAFEMVANEFLQNIQRKVSRGEKSLKDLSNVTGVVTRYFIPYFSDTSIDEIEAADIEEYKDWRMDYWVTGPGKDIQFITYKRGKHILKRPTRHEVPSSSRQHQELSMLRQLFKFAARKRYLDAKALPDIRAEPVRNNEGPGLTKTEYDHLINVSRSRLSTAPSEFIRDKRFVLDCFVHIAAHTGMRPTELMKMDWGDIHGFDLTNEDHPEAGAVEISVRGKGRFGNTVPMHSGTEVLVELLDLWWGTRKSGPQSDDPVFFHPNGTRIVSFKKSFATLLEAAGLLHDRQGRRRNAYCLRHFYITQQLIRGTPPYVVAINTRTSIQMIEKTYSHAVPSMFADQLRKDH